VGLLCGVSLLNATPPQWEREALMVTHSNDINLLGETSGDRFADDGLTGVLSLRYQTQPHAYEIQLNSYTQRHQSQGERVDTLSLGYFQGMEALTYRGWRLWGEMGVVVMRSGAFGGEGLQNVIHSLTGNPHYNLPFSSTDHTTIGLEGRVSTTHPLPYTLTLYTHTTLALQSDGSGRESLEVGIQRDYESLTLWGGAKAHHLTPFAHPIVEASTPDTQSLSWLFGGSYHLTPHYELQLESIIGGAPLGEEGDYLSTIVLVYHWD